MEGKFEPKLSSFLSSDLLPTLTTTIKQLSEVADVTKLQLFDQIWQSKFNKKCELVYEYEKNITKAQVYS